jgi:protein TonB
MAYADAGLRATSLAASATLLGLAVLAALTMSYTLRPGETPPQIGPIIAISPAPPPAPPSPAPEAPRVRGEEAPFVIDTPFAPQDLPVLSDISAGYETQAPHIITNPVWRRRPENLARYYPRRALQMGAEGEAVLDCLVTAGGALHCVVAAETPPGWGFGAAALRIAREHQMVPATRGGVAAEGRYVMRVPFQVQ